MLRLLVQPPLPDASPRIAGVARSSPAEGGRRLGWRLIAWLIVASPAAWAQAPPPCDSLLAAAEERYIQRAFADAEALARACLSQPGLTDDEALRAHRQLALVFLRRDDLTEAKQAVLRLLGVSFEYAPDPVWDPPAYVALVESIKEQLRVERMGTPADSARVGPPVAQAPPPEPEAEVQIVRPGADAPEAPSAEQEPERERRGLVRWLLIGGGALAASVAAVMLTSGGSSSPPSGGDPFPPPPALPR